MAKGHRSQIKKERNEQNKDTRPKAHAKYIKLSDTKARIVLEQIKGKPVREAEALLAYSPRYAAYVIGKTLHSAIANAENNQGLSPEKLYVQEAVASRGSAHYSRFRLRARARGRAYRIERKLCHISIILNEK
jgi:large subunit ribosomal protein L22